MSDTLPGTTLPDDNHDRPWWGLPCTVTPCFGARLVQEGNRLHYLADRAGIRGRFSDADAYHLDQAFPLLMKQLELMLTSGELNPRLCYPILKSITESFCSSTNSLLLMMGPFLGPKKLTTLTNNINNNKLNKKFHSCRGHQIPFKRNLPSPRKRWVWQHTCLISTHFYCNRLKSQHCQKALMTKQPWAGRCNHHTES